MSSSSGGANQGGSGGAGGVGAASGGSGGSKPTNEIWAKGFGSINDNQKGMAVAVDPTCGDGGCPVFAGHFIGSANFGEMEVASDGTSAADAFVVALNAQGEHQWSHVFGDSSDQRITGLAVGVDGNPVIAGRVRSKAQLPGGPLLTALELYDGFVAKLDHSSGNTLWAFQFGEATKAGVNDSQFAESVAIDAEGNVIVAGLFAGTIVVGTDTLAAGEDQDVFVAKLGPTGSPLWAVAVDGLEASNVASVAVGADGQVFLGGIFAGNLPAACGALAAQGSNDAYVLALEPESGACQWAQTWRNAASSQYVRAVAAHGTDVVAALDVNGTIDLGSGEQTGQNTDVGLTRLSGLDGTPKWGWRTSDGLNQFALDVAVDPVTDDIVLSGYFSAGLTFTNARPLNTTNGPDMYLARFNGGGEVRWAQGIGETSGGDDRGHSVAVDGQGNELLTGAFTSMTDFGTTKLTSYGVDDIFIAKFTPEEPAP